MNIDEFQKHLGYVFKNTLLLEEALTHKSYANENSSSHYERLEFLGDAVLDLGVGKMLFESYPQASEGELSLWRSSLVSEDSLYSVALELQLQSFVRMGRGEEAKPSILADSVESILGAIFADTGWGSALGIVKTVFAHRVATVRETAADPKGEFQARAQAQLGHTPTYAVVEESGPNHNRNYIVAALVEEKEWGRGQGTSKKRAEIAAALDALTNLERTTSNNTEQ